MIGNRIVDMTVSLTLPSGSYVPFVVISSATGLSTVTNYIYDIGADIATRATSAALAASGGAALIGTTTGTVQADLNARARAKTVRSGVTGLSSSNIAVLIDETYRAGAYTYQPWDFSTLITADTNSSYFDLAPASDVATSVGAWERTPSRDSFPYFFGYEYLSTFRKNLCDGSNGCSIVYSGDSTVAGTNLTPEFFPTALLAREALDHGAWKQVFYNRGQAGKSSADWIATYLAGDLTAAAGSTPGQLQIYRWDINDFDSAGANLTVAQSLANTKAGLTTVRNAYTAAQLSVLLMAPNGAIGRGRTESQWDELVTGLRRLAREFHCAFFDTYGFARNARYGYNWNSWDDLSGTLGAGAAAHPTDPLSGAIHAYLGEILYGGLGDQKNNTFWNRAVDDATVLSTDLIATFPNGTVIDHALAANGFLFDGTVVTSRANFPGSNIGGQTLYTASGVFLRTGGTSWTAWAQVPVKSTGWTTGTGTPNKGAFAAYAGATMSAGYVQAEAQASNDAAKNASQRIKAIEDALRSAGIIN